MVVLSQELLVDDRNLRSRFVDNVDVLNFIKTINLLPDNEHMSTRMVAEYYEVGEEAINSLIKDHRNELEEDGFRILTLTELKSFKDACSIKSKSRHMAKINRRCALRIGMLLRDSEVAKKVRTYLLNIHDSATEEQKSEVVEQLQSESSDPPKLKLVTTNVIPLVKEEQDDMELFLGSSLKPPSWAYMYFDAVVQMCENTNNLIKELAAELKVE